MRTLRHAVPLLGLSALALAGAAATAAPATAQGNDCAGAAIMSTATSDVAATSTTQSVVSGLRVGRHASCDRIVIEFTGPMPGYRVGYVAAVHQDASGEVVPLEGSAFLSIVLRPTSTSAPAVQPNLRPEFPVLRQMRGAGDFEAVTSYGAGLASKQPFLAYRLNNPNRLVIDIADSAGGSQVTRTPTGGVETGGGTTAGTAASATDPLAAGLLVAGAGLLVGCALITIRRRSRWTS